MRLPNSAHTSQPWRIHEVAPDLKVEDVWQVAALDGLHEFREAVRLVAASDPIREGPLAVRALFALRWRLGELLGWDDEASGLGGRVPTLRERLPADLRDTPIPEFEGLPFTALYLLDDEFAAEAANATMHGVMHLGAVADDAGTYHVRMAVLVKPNGRLGEAYMAAIRPFRHLIVYPPMLREAERIWRERPRDATAAPA